MKKTPEYCFFCLPDDINIDDYSEMLQWGYDHSEAPTVLSLTQEQLDYYHEVGLWDLMSDHTDYMIGPSDSNVIFDEEIQNIRDAIVQDVELKDDFIIKIIEILDYAILHKKAVVMNFG
ncbi:DMP12 family DNA mimic protein [Psychrobacter glaciei]|uniref:DMP12 family DNA mimic protein n=1 Tax=Psychrobacter glaciei TaxID=619771 RepID=UPI001F06D448|nr:DMP12 family DNA mimic protein [Psychrobacter glaciei]MCH1783867.1 DMP12 family DNA mimic protein [Psychrobacter glaciei]